MRLGNVVQPGDDRPVNISIAEEKIAGIDHTDDSEASDPFTIDLAGALVFPGLINAHDHLDFNCFSPLGDRKYRSYREWGKDIHSAYRREIEAVVKIPARLRAAWGMYKNLLCGVTTVMQHGPLPRLRDTLINIEQRSLHLHSVGFEKHWRRKLNNPFSRKCCVIHCGEGIDIDSKREIDELIDGNFVNRALVGVHGVAMSAAQAKKFRALVWCPESNETLLDAQPDIAVLKQHTKILFGTDSTLSAGWNIWNHLRLARALEKMTDQELSATVSSAPASVFNLNRGKIACGWDADIAIAQPAGTGSGWSRFFSTDPSDLLLVLQRGHIRVFDASLLDQLSDKLSIPDYFQITINGSIKYVQGDLPGLVNSIHRYHDGICFPFDTWQHAADTTYA